MAASSLSFEESFGHACERPPCRSRSQTHSFQLNRARSSGRTQHRRAPSRGLLRNVSGAHGTKGPPAREISLRHSVDDFGTVEDTVDLNRGLVATAIANAVDLFSADIVPEIDCLVSDTTMSEHCNEAEAIIEISDAKCLTESDKLPSSRIHRPQEIDDSDCYDACAVKFVSTLIRDAVSEVCDDGIEDVECMSEDTDGVPESPLVSRVAEELATPVVGTNQRSARALTDDTLVIECFEDNDTWEASSTFVNTLLSDIAMISASPTWSMHVNVGHLPDEVATSCESEEDKVCRIKGVESMQHVRKLTWFEQVCPFNASEGETNHEAFATKLVSEAVKFAKDREDVSRREQLESNVEPTEHLQRLTCFEEVFPFDDEAEEREHEQHAAWLLAQVMNSCVDNRRDVASSDLSKQDVEPINYDAAELTCELHATRSAGAALNFGGDRGDLEDEFAGDDTEPIEVFVDDDTEEREIEFHATRLLSTALKFGMQDRGDFLQDDLIDEDSEPIDVSDDDTEEHEIEFHATRLLGAALKLGMDDRGDFSQDELADDDSVPIDVSDDDTEEREYEFHATTLVEKVFTFCLEAPGNRGVVQKVDMQAEATEQELDKQAAEESERLRAIFKEELNIRNAEIKAANARKQAAVKRRVEQAEAARRCQEDPARLRAIIQEETLRKAAEDKAVAQREASEKLAQEAAKAEEEAKKQAAVKQAAEEEAARVQAAKVAARIAEETEAKQAAEEEAARLRAETAQVARDQAAAKVADDMAVAQREASEKLAQAARAKEEAEKQAAGKQAAEEEVARVQAAKVAARIAEETAAKKAAEEEAARIRAEKEQAARDRAAAEKAAEDEAAKIIARKSAEEKAARQRAAKAKAAEEKAALLRAKIEAEKKAAEDEAAMLIAEEEARLRAEEARDFEEAEALLRSDDVTRTAVAETNVKAREEDDEVSKLIAEEEARLLASEGVARENRKSQSITSSPPADNWARTRRRIIGRVVREPAPCQNVGEMVARPRAQSRAAPTSRADKKEQSFGAVQSFTMDVDEEVSSKEARESSLVRGYDALGVQFFSMHDHDEPPLHTANSRSNSVSALEMDLGIDRTSCSRRAPSQPQRLLAQSRQHMATLPDYENCSTTVSHNHHFSGSSRSTSLGGSVLISGAADRSKVSASISHKKSSMSPSPYSSKQALSGKRSFPATMKRTVEMARTASRYQGQGSVF